jgi:hypothetical protein
VNLIDVNNVNNKKNYGIGFVHTGKIIKILNVVFLIYSKNGMPVQSKFNHFIERNNLSK